MRVGTGMVGRCECKMSTISHVAEASGGSASELSGSSASDSSSGVGGVFLRMRKAKS